jgi:hypothetical protein
MPKSKIDAKAVREGDRGVKFQVKAADKDFGSMHCQIDLHLASDAKALAVLAAAEKAEGMLDGMEVDPADPESIQRYIGACGFALEGVIRAMA